MKWLFITVFAFMIVFGAVIIFQERNEAQDTREIRNYVATKGRTKVPEAWRTERGRGI